MYGKKIIFTIALLGSLFVAFGRASNAQQIDNSSQNSSVNIDRQMSEKARKAHPRVSFYYIVSAFIINSWEKTVDTAGLHTLLNQNQKAYTLFKPDFDRINQECTPAKRPGGLTNAVTQTLSKCVVGYKGDVLSKLFAMENQADLQRVLKCHVVPQKIVLKDLPNDKEITFKTMEPGCNITVRANHFQKPAMKVVTERTNECDGCRVGQSTTYIPTGKMENHTDFFVNSDTTGTRANPFRTEQIDKGEGNYIVYKFIDGVIIPPDLRSKYKGLPAGGRPLTD